ncbi:MAG: Putative phosphohydrolase [Clostridiales bacterium 38_11]|nr:MAG: Putative phosphohydrolase [Clostridiales bacterium 38_11]HBH13163.1 serine/threonine protein phosphatase [Clostridiales bacterium]
MKIFGISDLHLDSKKEKPMDVFGKNWENHDLRIFEDWYQKVKPEDIVLMPGDISWANSLKEAESDLRTIDLLPGRKVISKGNHDYWWTSLKKMKSFEFDSIFFLHNNCYQTDELDVYGTRGWLAQDGDDIKAEDYKIIRRELIRLNNSLKSSIKDNTKVNITLLHFSPFDSKGNLNVFGELICKQNIDFCLYGHLHGIDGHRNVKEGLVEKTRFICVAADYVDFKLKEIIEF